ncbi:hypothetical protein [Acinetobacter baumannii]|uniref:hypothetical protein n=1 Tax=Acinetobacter baumannii TaxID=470 RepID=UPI0020CEFEF2|nr:hypothetical protein [Acinetobacter baumannii]MCQ1104416.1 hypothetical protein [Acinetobacter baumannii]MDH2536763.1 hypothetical protein [Acinetobacter baumannii]MDV7673816.1 hypothetical protein [Acinetobacter baumannii]HCA5025328.1 hypothetical protein [Acinetobacter baumannii]HCV3155218.1 hypothetical protein [Acinetobacter baumannii]
MNRLQLILLVLSTATFSPFVFSETTLSPTKYEFYGQESKRHKSMLEVNNSSDHKINESQHNPFRSDSNKQNVDFFEIAKHYQEQQPQNIYSHSPDHTVNMSDHERSLYYIRNHDNMGLQRDVRYQQYRSLKQQYDKGVISRDEYKNKVYKISR